MHIGKKNDKLKLTEGARQREQTKLMLSWNYTQHFKSKWNIRKSVLTTFWSPSQKIELKKGHEIQKDDQKRTKEIRIFWLETKETAEIYQEVCMTEIYSQGGVRLLAHFIFSVKSKYVSEKKKPKTIR